VNGYGKTILVLFVALAAFSASGDMDTARPGCGEVDTRIWNLGYWMEMAEQGRASVNPVVPVEDAVFKSSRLDHPGVRYDDSPDVAVTTDPNTTQSENSVFVNPLDTDAVLNSNNSTDWPCSQVYGAPGFISTDVGQTWSGDILGCVPESYCDPASAVGLNGWYYVGFVDDYYGQGIGYSTDGGASWTYSQVCGGGYLLDKNHLWIDNGVTSPYEGNLYSAWTNFQGGANDDEIELARSTDGGLNWDTPVNISAAVGAGSHCQGVNIKTGPNGEVYAVFAIYDDWPQDEPALGFAKSTDGGGHFAPATRIIEDIRGIRETWTSKNMRVNSFPVMAVDISDGPHSANIYVVWANIGVPGINVGPEIDVYMIRSEDGGSSWSSPIRVNQDPSGMGSEHYFPWITCDPVTGTLCVVFYDDRNVPSTDCEVFVAVSDDAGDTWEDFRVSDVSFTPVPVPGLAYGYFGDYIGISARGGKVYPMWTDNRSGRALTYVSPLSLEVCGDANGDGSVTSGDGYTVLNYFGAGPQPVSCFAANVNGDSGLTTGDGYHLLNYLGAGTALNCAPCEF
jgi:hypothetical protein